MSLRNCIVEAEAEGTINNQQAREASDLFEELYDDFLKTMSKEEAEIAAGRQTFDQLKADKAHKRTLKLLTARRYAELTRELSAYRTGRGQIRPGEALQALVERNPQSRFSDLHYHQEAVRRRAFAEMDGILAKHRRNITGSTRNKAGTRDLVREAFGEDSGSKSAKELIQGWKSTHEYLRQRFNAAGGRIGKLENYGLPQIHEARSVRSAGLKAWIDYVTPRLNVENMIDERTGQPFSPLALKTVLQDSWHRIAYEGRTPDPTATGGKGKMLANRRMDHRFLHFKDAKSWMEYQEKFGSPDAFVTMVNHIDKMARDITLLEIMGPNPNAMKTHLAGWARSQADRAGEDVIQKTRGDIRKFENLYDAFEHPVSVQNEKIANIFGSTRDVLQASMLGGAPISAVADFNTQRITAAMAGMPQIRLMKRIVGNISGLGLEEKSRLATRLVLGAESWTSTNYTSSRLFGDVNGPEITKRLADASHRVSGLNHFTQQGRQAFGFEFIQWMADNFGKTWDDLPKNLRETFERDHMTAGEWEIIRKTPLTDVRGIKVLNAMDIEKRTDLAPIVARRLMDRVVEMVARETDMAVPMATTRSRTAFSGRSDAGTLSGEILKSAGMFKTFPVTVILNNMNRYISLNGKYNKARWVGDFVISTAIIGGLILQAKQILRGKDPREMDEPEFWLAALLQGGGLGIFGDFMFQSVNRFGNGFGVTLAGPVAGLVNDTRELTIGNIIQAASGDDMNLGSDLVNYMARYTPFGSTWYIRGAYERAILDSIQRWTDPEAETKWHKRRRRMERDYGQSYFWDRGELTPERAPDFNVFGGRQ
jgi:hypothetical protein